MALSVKVALATCLGFIFGMSWLVSLVARPVVEMPTPLIVRGSAAGRGVLVADVDSPSPSAGVIGRFAWSSPLEVGTKRNWREGGARVVAEAMPPDADFEERWLPPLYVPEAPVIAQVPEPGAEAATSPGAGSSVMTITSIPEAIVADVPAHGARVLAALVADAQSGEEMTPEPQAGADHDWTVQTVKKYKVKPGDTLVKIMRREWNSDDAKLLEVLLAANPEVAKRRDRIFPGEVLNIPDLKLSERAAAAAWGAKRAEPGERAGRSVSAGKAGVRWYTIRKRDSLASIARRLLNDERRWREIARLNEMRNAHRILPGTRIKLPPPVSKET